MITYRILVSAVALSVLPPPAPAAEKPAADARIAPIIPVSAASARDNAGIFGIDKVHQVRISLAVPEWNALQSSNARGGLGTPGEDYKAADGRLIHTGSGFRGYYPWAHADVVLNGKEIKDAGLRYRGNSSFSSSSAAAPLRANMKLKIDLHGAKGSWEGVNTVNFNAGTLDTSLMREAVAFAVFRAAGVPAPRTAYAELIFSVPGLYQETSGGMYVLIENVNKGFLKEALPPGTGLLMKPEGLRGGIQSQGTAWASFAAMFRPDREATLHEQQRVMEFSRLISQTDVALFRAKIADFLDIDQFLRFVAVNAFLQNWDSYLGGSHNFYLYLDPKDDKFRFIPWDEDLSMGARANTMFSMNTPLRGDQPLIYWLLDDPAVKRRYNEIVRELTATAFSQQFLSGLMDKVESAAKGRNGAAVRIFLNARATEVKQQFP